MKFIRASQSAVLKKYRSIKRFEDVKRFVVDGVREDVWLEFKVASELGGGFNRDDQKHFAKAVSGFANEEGGIVVWGIKCVKDRTTEIDVATELVPITNIKGFVSRLDSLAGQASDPFLGGIQNKAIAQSGVHNSGFIVTYIPKGEALPYKALLGVNDFYGRSGSGFSSLATHQIRRLMMLTSIPELDVVYRIQKGGQSSGPSGERYDVDIIFSLKNIGKTITTHPYMKITGPKGWIIRSVYRDVSRKLLEKVPYGDYVGGIDSACHPHLNLDVVVVHLELNPKIKIADDTEFTFNISFAAMNCPLKEKTIRIKPEELCGVWDLELCGVNQR